MIHVLLSLTLIAADNEKEPSWPSFRNGGSSVCTTGRLPVEWSPKKGITWQRELPGYGQSSPVIWGHSAYVLSVQGLMKEKCVITALDLQTGKIRWTKSWDSSTRAPSNYRVSRAAPTPVVDNDGVYAFFESGDLIGVSHKGKLLWKRSLTKEYGPFQNHHGLGSSPAGDAESLFVNVEHRGPSYLLAIDKATGKNRWKVERKAGMSWSSPIVLEGGQVLVSSNGTATGYDSKTGKVRWSLGGLGGNSKVSPTASGSSLFVAAEVSEFGEVADAARSNVCIQLDSKADKGYTVLWRARRAVYHYASPVAYRRCVYYLNQQGIVHCLDQKTGKPHYAERLRIPCWATPIAAGDYVYFFATDGTTKVLKAGPVFELVSTNLLWDLDNPPKPETYAEAKVERTPMEGKGGPFSQLLKGDKDGDGKLSADELPQRLKAIFPNVDLDKDGKLDAGELKKMDAQFRQRRVGSREASRDPIVCGVAAAGGYLLIRTGTRLYCVGTP